MRNQEWLYHVKYYELDVDGNRIGYLKFGLAKGENDEKAIGDLHEQLVLLEELGMGRSSIEVTDLRANQRYSEIMPILTPDERCPEEIIMDFLNK